jgi:hypothetical protein
VPNKPFNPIARKTRSGLTAALGVMNLRATVLIAVILNLSAAGCAQGDMKKPIASVEEGLHLVDSFIGNVQDFELAVPDSLLDPVGVNMALITDRALARGWEPNGFTQRQGYRILRYKEFK